MKYLNAFTIDGDPILVPDANVKFEKNDIDSEGSGRDEQGFMHRIVLRRRVKKWSFNYSCLSQEEYEYMNNLFEGRDTFTFGYTDAGESKTVTAYCSSNVVSIYDLRRGLYKGLSFNITEC